MDLSLVQFDYCNYKGEKETRLVRPIKIWFGSTSFHPEPQWLLEAFDVVRGETRDFAMAGIRAWRVNNAPTKCDN